MKLCGVCAVRCPCYLLIELLLSVCCRRASPPSMWQLNTERLKWPTCFCRRTLLQTQQARYAVVCVYERERHRKSEREREVIFKVSFQSLSSHRSHLTSFHFISFSHLADALIQSDLTKYRDIPPEASRVKCLAQMTQRHLAQRGIDPATF